MPKKATATPKDTTIKTKSKTIAKQKADTKTKPTDKAPIAPQITLDMCVLMDCTSSMQEWIERSKETLHEIINNTRRTNPDLRVRVSFVGYRDIRDDVRFCVKPFSENLDEVKTYISNQVADGGRDWPEDVQGGLNQALLQGWEKDSIKQAFLICDAPGHGVDLTNDPITDDYPAGSPDGFNIRDQMKSFAQQNINFTIVKVNEDCNLMISVMESAYKFNAKQSQFNVSDLAKVCEGKDKAAVTKSFVSAASFILSAALGAGKKKAPGKPLWDTKQFATGQWFSQTMYLVVKEMDGKQVTVENQFGDRMHLSRDILENMESADHFEKEVPCTMTELAEKLNEASDTVFTVLFHKKPKEDEVMDKIQNTPQNNFKNQAELGKLVKSLTEGDECLMHCHLVECESALGRSTVIDLGAKTQSKFRQVDHRTIQYIILRNVKYVLKKSGGKKVAVQEDSDDDMAGDKKKKKQPKWNATKLAVGNYFSGSRYFRAVEINGDQVKMRSESQDVVVSRDIVETQMYSAGIFSKEEKLPMTKLCELLEQAQTTCFTVQFKTKIDEKAVRDRLTAVTAAELKNPKVLAKELLSGKESTIVGRLSKADGKLGRSLVIDLPTQGYRQVDHRSIQSLIFKDVKYVLK